MPSQRDATACAPAASEPVARARNSSTARRTRAESQSILAQHRLERSLSISGMGRFGLLGGDRMTDGLLNRVTDGLLSMDRATEQIEDEDEALQDVSWRSLPFFSQDKDRIDAIEDTLDSQGRNIHDHHTLKGRLLRPFKGWAKRNKLLAFAIVTTVSYLFLSALISAVFGMVVDYIVLPGQHLDQPSPVRLFGAALIAVPVLVFLDVIGLVIADGAGRGDASAGHKRKSRYFRLPEALVYVTFTGMLTTSAFLALDPNDRFALRTRVKDMVLDEFLLEGKFPGDLMMIDSVPELYEWMQGPLAEHFTCAEPAWPSRNPALIEMCYLPDGTFVSDGLIEIRQLRVKANPSPLPYYTASNKWARVAGEELQWGGRYYNQDNRQEDPWWTLDGARAPDAMPSGSVEPITLPWDPHLYVNSEKLVVQPIERYGWYDVYYFGGYVFRSGGSADEFRANVTRLSDAGFIDSYTRALQVSTALMNPSTELGALVTVLIEFPSSGVIRITPDVLVMRRSSETAFLAFDASQISFTVTAAFLFYTLLTEASKYYFKGRRWYFSKFSNLFDWAIIVILLQLIVDHFRVAYRMPDLSGTDASAVLLQAGYTINYTSQRISSLTGVLLWFVVLRALKFIPNLLSARLNLMALTLINSAMDLLAFFGTAFVFLIAFAFIFHFTLGNYLPEFATFQHAFFTVICGLSSVWDPGHWYEADPITSVVLLLAFTSLCTWMLATMVIAIITEAFVAAKADLAIKLQLERQEKLRMKEASRLQVTEWLKTNSTESLKPGGGKRPHLDKLSRAAARLRNVTGNAAQRSAKAAGFLSSFRSMRDRTALSPQASLLASRRVPSDMVGAADEGAAGSAGELASSPSGRSPAGGGNSKWGMLRASMNRQSFGSSCKSGKGGSGADKPDSPASNASTPTEKKSSSWRPSVCGGTDRLGRFFLPLGGADSPAPKAYLLKGMLWRGIDLFERDQACNPVARLSVEVLPAAGAESKKRPSERPNLASKSMASVATLALAKRQEGTRVHDTWTSKTPAKSKKEGMRSPEWNESFTLQVPPEVERVNLVIAVYDRDRFSKEHLLAYTVVPISRIEQGERFSAAFQQAPAAVKPKEFEFTLHHSRAQLAKMKSKAFFHSAKPVEVEDPRMQFSFVMHERTRKGKTARRGSPDNLPAGQSLSPTTPRHVISAPAAESTLSAEPRTLSSLEVKQEMAAAPQWTIASESARSSAALGSVLVPLGEEDEADDDSREALGELKRELSDTPPDTPPASEPVAGFVAEGGAHVADAEGGGGEAAAPPAASPAPPFTTNASYSSDI